MNALLKLITLLTLTLSVQACALTGAPITGKVLEEGTNNPIPGAIVAVTWIGRTTSGSIYVESGDVCYHVETVTTNEQGFYQTQAWSQEQHKDYTVKFDHKQVTAYKAGYGVPQRSSQKDGVEYLAKFKGTREERLEYLWRMRPSCDAQNESEENKLPLLKALYDEAKLHGGDKKPAPNTMSLMESIVYDIEIIEFGFEEAESRHLKRP